MRAKKPRTYRMAVPVVVSYDTATVNWLRSMFPTATRRSDRDVIASYLQDLLARAPKSLAMEVKR